MTKIKQQQQKVTTSSFRHSAIAFLDIFCENEKKKKIVEKIKVLALKLVKFLNENKSFWICFVK